MDRYSAEVRAAADELAEVQRVLNGYRLQKDRLPELDELRLWFLAWERRAAAARFREAVQAQITHMEGEQNGR